MTNFGFEGFDILQPHNIYSPADHRHLSAKVCT